MRFTLALLTAACFAPLASAQVADFDSIKLYTLKNDNGMTVKVTNYGAIVTHIMVPDRNGMIEDVALGYDRVESYMNAVDKPYFGAIVGRYGNRIANGEFTLNGETYSVLKNNGPNHLHGGAIGFDKVVWDAKFNSANNSLTLSYLAKDKEEGYPGNLKLQVKYTLTGDNALVVDYHATTDKATPINVTQHTYFNLKGEGNGDILGHELMLNAKQYTPVDETMIPNGKIADVAGTPFDFTASKPIGRDIEQENEQLKFGLGFDHNWVLDKAGKPNALTLAARVHEPTSGRTLEIHTTEPGVQFYCGNFLDGRLKGKAGKPYVKRGGFCLETQHYPDSPNQPSFPSTILKPGDKFESQTIFRFSTASKSTKLSPESLVGKYKYVRGVKDGEKLDAAHFDKQFVEFTKDQLTLNSPDAKFVLSYKLDTSATPAKVALEITDSPFGSGMKSQGIIQSKDGKLQLCYPPMGGTTPKDFEAKDGSGHYMFELKKQ